MGQGSFRKPVTPIVVKRRSSAMFRVGFAEMNGWRASMEDAHVIFIDKQWGFFGILDGHGGSQCSNFIARRLEEELAHGMPKDDASMSALMLRLDHEFLETKQPSGSTGTFVLVQPPVAPDGRYMLRVGNIGDSRVLLGRSDGSLVDHHGGTDGALTTDHKPDHPNEKARIERTGGQVKHVLGVARVNGDLAVSRAFGDAQYKETGGPSQEDHPVSAAPELISVNCDPQDFIVLVCDGISEGNFPNRAVVELISEELKKNPDPGAAAAAVTRKALASGSRDNLSCMIVMLGGCDGVEAKGPEYELLSGPFTEPKDANFRKAYAAMVEHAGLTLAEALEKRYDDAQGLRSAYESRIAEDQSGSESATERPRKHLNIPKAEIELTELTEEIDSFGEGPSSALKVGSPERIQYFEEWLAKAEAADVESQALSASEFMDMCKRRAAREEAEELEMMTWTEPEEEAEPEEEQFDVEEGTEPEEENYDAEDRSREGGEPEFKRRRMADDIESCTA